MKSERARLYDGRKLSDAYPGLDRLYDETFNQTLTEASHGTIARQLTYLERLLHLRRGRTLVIGCGPQPTVVKELLERGFDAIGVEPVGEFARAARLYLQAPDRVLQSQGESIPLPDGSVELVYCNSVLEHVDSPSATLREMHRVLQPGCAAMIYTTNRFRVSLRGDNGEYDIPFFNWLPPVLRECFAFQHLHYDPRLARFTDRPAVHWFTFSDLCRRGREAGFARFYSTLDLLAPEDPPLQRRPLRQRLVAAVQKSPWLRAMVLTTTYFGGIIIMVKRRD
jgi:SAM-dependent methyltransferase